MKNKQVVGSEKVSNAGRPVTTGDTPGSKYTEWLEAQGLDKKTIMKRITDSVKVDNIIEQIHVNTVALETAKLLNDAASEYYNNNKNRDLSLNRQLQQVDVAIKKRQIQNQEEGRSDVDDKNLLKWLELRHKLMSDINKEKMELTKMATDKDSVVKAEDIDWDGI